MIATLRRAKPLSCSFCLRTADRLRNLMAGSQAHICDDCVRSCLAIMDATPQEFSGWEATDSEALLAQLPIAEATVEATRSVLQLQIETLRTRGVSWDKIGKSLGISRQAAWERFS